MTIDRPDDYRCPFQDAEYRRSLKINEGQGCNVNLDVAIMAGGRATRLAGIWDKSKILVPVGGVPLLVRLLEAITALRPRRLVLLLDDRAQEIVQHPAMEGLAFPLDYSVEAPPQGTASAFRKGVESGAIHVDVPLVLLNHDTLPLYPLQALAGHHEQRVGTWATGAFVHEAARWRDIYAGACAFSAEAVRDIAAERRTHDLYAHLIGAQRFLVPGFLDVGTPDGFKRAQDWKE